MKMLDKSKLLLLAALAEFSLGNNCPTGFEEINGYCLQFHAEVRMNWYDAAEFCVNITNGLGMLAKVDHGNTLRGIAEFIDDFDMKKSFWLGGSDESVEGDWRWRDDTRVPFGTPFWAIHSGLLVISAWDHEPSGGKGENCLLLNEERLYYFDDEDCSHKAHPLCSIYQ
ncbi:unnamed protein product [Meganyctiphanes norvegica]|uniref:C-type lectin domain-containing protein n=1 Tax=Meganyctiphanes norvegica TaxID=48144 RepID=A0AAV2QBN2_MEGNR